MSGQARVVVVMGVSGVGKSTVGADLARELDVPYAEADDFHPPANVAKMAAGTPLDDADRAPWLAVIGGWARERIADGEGGVVTCSALKRRYRDALREAAGGPLFFVHLDGSRTVIGERHAARAGHFMPTTLVDSQFADLEPLQADEDGAVVPVDAAARDVTSRARDAVRAAYRRNP